MSRESRSTGKQKLEKVNELRFNASSDLCINLYYLLIYMNPVICAFLGSEPIQQIASPNPP